jgi:hypothetical protein
MGIAPYRIELFDNKGLEYIGYAKNKLRTLKESLMDDPYSNFKKRRYSIINKDNTLLSTIQIKAKKDGCSLIKIINLEKGNDYIFMAWGYQSYIAYKVTVDKNGIYSIDTTKPEKYDSLKDRITVRATVNYTPFTSYTAQSNSNYNEHQIFVGQYYPDINKYGEKFYMDIGSYLWLVIKGIPFPYLPSRFEDFDKKQIWYSAPYFYYDPEGTTSFYCSGRRNFTTIEIIDDPITNKKHTELETFERRIVQDKTDGKYYLMYKEKNPNIVEDPNYPLIISDSNYSVIKKEPISLDITTSNDMENYVETSVDYSDTGELTTLNGTRTISTKFNTKITSNVINRNIGENIILMIGKKLLTKKCINSNSSQIIKVEELVNYSGSGSTTTLYKYFMGEFHPIVEETVTRSYNNIWSTVDEIRDTYSDATYYYKIGDIVIDETYDRGNGNSYGDFFQNEDGALYTTSMSTSTISGRLDEVATVVPFYTEIISSNSHQEGNLDFYKGHTTSSESTFCTFLDYDYTEDASDNLNFIIFYRKDKLNSEEIYNSKWDAIDGYPHENEILTNEITYDYSSQYYLFYKFGEVTNKINLNINNYVASDELGYKRIKSSCQVNPKFIVYTYIVQTLVQKKISYVQDEIWETSNRIIGIINDKQHEVYNVIPEEAIKIQEHYRNELSIVIGTDFIQKKKILL